MTLALPKNEMSAIAGSANAATRTAANNTTLLFLIIPLLEEIKANLPPLELSILLSFPRPGNHLLLCPPYAHLAPQPDKSLQKKNRVFFRLNTIQFLACQPLFRGHRSPLAIPR